MSDYRLYYLDNEGWLGLPDWIKASDDQDAVRQAQIMKRNARQCEVWERGRLVAQLDAQSLAA